MWSVTDRGGLDANWNLGQIQIDPIDEEYIVEKFNMDFLGKKRK